MNMLQGVEWGLWMMVIASGFVVAGFLNALHETAIGEDGRFRLLFHSPFAVAWSVVMCMFAGPYWVFSRSVSFWLGGELPNSMLAFCLLLSLLWSFCCGIFVLEMAYLMGFVG